MIVTTIWKYISVLPHTYPIPPSALSNRQFIEYFKLSRRAYHKDFYGICTCKGIDNRTLISQFWLLNSNLEIEDISY